jgi:hypothetical protein
VKTSSDTRLTIVLVLLVAFQAYVALYRGTPSGDGADQELMLLQHSSGDAPSRAHGEGDHQRFGSGDGQPTGLYQVNAPPGTAQGAQPGFPPTAGREGAPPPIGYQPGAPVNPGGASGGEITEQGSSAAGAPKSVFERLESGALGPTPHRPGPSPHPYRPGSGDSSGKPKHQPDPTERLLMGIIYLQSTRHAVNHQQSQRILAIVKTSESTKEAIPNAMKVFDETLSEEQKNLVQSLRVKKFKAKKPLPPGSMMPLLRRSLQKLRPL